MNESVPELPEREDTAVGERLDPTLDFVQSEALANVLDQYLADLKAGHRPDRDAILRQHPELAAQLEACLAGIEFIHAAGHLDGESSAPKRLGEFRILREVGRGGMGAVYEAEQASLGRRVALKVLRFSGGQDQESIQRFQREAETIARLHHTSIVPIFAVGTENGVNYYAMQFIEGRSLDHVLQDQAGPLATRKVVEWCLQAAEALEHAHARSVIHRDVKPSNLILDAEDRIWLTDFGLAKRHDDVSLSMTGALLGTPRYMSPEQASAHEQIDCRTDIYSLGATLYEMLTGQPVFDGETPPIVLQQVLNDDPLPIREHHAELTRDLETIVMKCLAKDPDERYATAQALAADLRAYLEGRSITARRAGPVERAAKWLKRQRRSVALAVGAVSATLMTLIILFTANYVWHRSQVAWFLGRAANPPVVAELVSESGVAVPPLVLPMAERMQVPSGEYSVRVKGPARFAESFDMTLRPGQSFDHRFDLGVDSLWRDVPVPRSYAVLRGGDRDRILIFSDRGAHCLDGADASTLWEIEMAAGKAFPDDAVVSWPPELATYISNYGVDGFDVRPLVTSQVSHAWPGAQGPEALTSPAEPAAGMDLNGDRIPDVLVASRCEAWMLALNGADGKTLWSVLRDEGSAQARQVRGARNGVVYQPLAIPDQNRDGTPDVLAVFADASSLLFAPATPAKRWIELISGADGTSLWSYEFPDSLFPLDAKGTAPDPFRWFYGSGGGHSQGGGFFMGEGEIVVREGFHASRGGSHLYVPSPPTLLHGGEPEAFAVQCFAGSHAIFLDARTGEPSAAPVDTGIRMMTVPIPANLDGDGTVDWILAEQLAPLTNPARVTPLPQARLTAWSGAKKDFLWQRTIGAQLPRQHATVTAIPAWPLAHDIDGDGIDEVLTPTGQSLGSSQYVAPWGQIALLEGATGETRWTRRLLNIDHQVEYFTVGPDLDEDGKAELFVACQWGTYRRVHVDCLSGADGRSLWRNDYAAYDDTQWHREYHLTNLQWHPAGADGWPALVVTVRLGYGEVADRTLLISSATGELIQQATEVAAIESVELDGDGLPDMLAYQRATAHGWGPGRLHAVRGRGRELWKRVGLPLQPVGDLDRDGVVDLADARRYSNELTVRSGLTGKLMWQARLENGVYDMKVHSARGFEPSTEYAAASSDLNGDGTPDFLISLGRALLQNPLPLVRAVSGKDGRVLWRSEARGRRHAESAHVECRDLDGDGRLEVIIVATTDDLGPAVAEGHSQLRLTVLSGQTGRTQWQIPLGPTSPDRMQEGLALEITYEDLNGDGALDLVVPAMGSETPPAMFMRALSGTNGRPLWSVEIASPADPREAFQGVCPAAIADLDADGQLEAILLDLGTLTPAGGVTPLRVIAVDGRSGEAKWEWQTEVDARSNRLDASTDKIRNRLRPVVLERETGRHWVALAAWNTGRELFVLDEQGKQVSRWKVVELARPEGTRIWPIRLAGESQDSLILLTREKLQLLDPERLDQPRWSRAVQGADLNDIVGILSESEVGRILVQGGQGDYGIRGLRAEDGSTEWLCPGPVSGSSFDRMTSQRLLSLPTNERPPLVFLQVGGVVSVRAGNPIVAPAETAGQLALADWRTFARPTPVLEPRGPDVRGIRPLPWQMDGQAYEEIPERLAWTAFFGVTLFAVPTVYGIWLFRGRRWSLRTLLVMPAVVGVVMLGVLVDPRERDLQSLTDRITLAFLAAGPVLAAAALVAAWLLRGKWGRVLAWLAATGLVALIAAAVMLYGNSSILLEEESYSWSGWYLIGVPVFYASCWALIGLCLVAAAWQWLKRTRELESAA